MTPVHENQAKPGKEEPHAVLDLENVERLLQAECLLWQERLRLQDWNVEVRLCRLNEIAGGDALASITHYEERKDAVMRLLAPMDIPLVKEDFLGCEASNYDLSIVHELLHLHLIPLSDYNNPAKRVAEEQAINAISRCLVDAITLKQPETPLIKPVEVPTPPLNSGHYL